ncbi:alpha-amylase family glycosyl hydrolase [Ancylobacter sp. FA202]|uniref:alpha-amylase family glycosyl hydrolase n=1 Tax=Ancylobacter sp. FA202 TaxID=1111106 RepID=UPI00037F9E33|nr:alpha-amylase family glycosyl hydrolase [Ancylobacter sp. FA202]
MAQTQWWQRGIFYQVYPRSFQDTNGDGIGDLDGIRARLDYLVALGIDAVWISPIFPSPMADFGYDVADYCGIDPMFGDLDAFDRLIEEAHARRLKIVLDFVPNHTSDQHPWFAESRASRENPRRDWYIWRDPAPDGGPPNNWMSNFGGPAWTYDPASGQYYYHAFLTQQPDLNWRNPQVRAAMHDVLRFWMARGVDGFRVDVIWHLMKDANFRDNPPNPEYGPGDADIRRFLQTRSTDQPDVHAIIAELRAVIDEYEDRVLIGEIYLPIDRLVAYYGENLEGAHLPFNFQLIHASWSAPRLAELIADYDAAVPEGGWPNWVLGNHDQPRIASRIGARRARVAAMLLLTLRGTPTMYYGDEIGMENVPIATEDAHDPWEKNEPGLGLGRDPERTPMQWDASPNAGFTNGRPWLPLAADFTTRNVAVQLEQPASLLGLYRDLIALRRAHPVLHAGTYRKITALGDVLVFLRESAEECVLVALNLAGTVQDDIPLPPGTQGRVLLSTEPDRPREERVEGHLSLRPHEGVIVALDARL